MPKKLAKAKARAPEIELNRWCVEMAIRWPVITEAYGSGSYGGMSQLPRTASHTDADVIGRAKKLRDWVTEAA